MEPERDHGLAVVGDVHVRDAGSRAIKVRLQLRIPGGELARGNPHDLWLPEVHSYQPQDRRAAGGVRMTRELACDLGFRPDTLALHDRVLDRISALDAIENLPGICLDVEGTHGGEA